MRRSEKWSAGRRMSDRAHRLRRKAAGLCILCEEPARPGKTMCLAHAMSLSVRRAKKYLH